MKDILITSCSRTAVGSLGKTLKNVKSDEMGAAVISNEINNSGLKSSDIDEVIMGQVLTGGVGQNPARQAAIKSGIPKEKPAYIVNQVCGSGIRSIVSGFQSIRSGDSKIVIAGGQESMSSAPHAIHLRDGKKLGDAEIIDTMIKDGLWDAFHGYHMGITAENVADSFGITREEQEEFALLSHQKASNASLNGFFTEEIVNISHDDVNYSKDGCIRGDTTLDSMSSLKSAFREGGSVTAATSSPLTDGAVFSIICSENLAKSLNLSPIAAIVAGAVSGCPPELMGLGPISAVKKVLDIAGWKIDEVDIFELNEAFASQSIACIRELGIDIDRVNLDGGALAIGHPLGASGARITCKAASLMNRTGANRAIATMCIGGGMGMAIALETLD